MSKGKIYAVYKGDKFITVGTVAECAKDLNVKKETIRYLNSKYYKSKNESGKRVEVFEIET